MTSEEKTQVERLFALLDDYRRGSHWVHAFHDKVVTETRAALAATAVPSAESNQGREDRLRRERFQRELAEPSAHVNLTPDGTTVVNPSKPFAYAPDARRAELLAAMEKVVRVFAQHIRTSPKFEGQLTTPADNGLLGRVAQDLENLDVAALLEAK
jgi:hypothetical protein